MLDLVRSRVALAYIASWILDLFSSHLDLVGKDAGGRAKDPAVAASSVASHHTVVWRATERTSQFVRTVMDAKQPKFFFMRTIQIINLTKSLAWHLQVDQSRFVSVPGPSSLIPPVARTSPQQPLLSMPAVVVPAVPAVPTVPTIVVQAPAATASSARALSSAPLTCQWTGCSQLRPTNDEMLQHVAEAHLSGCGSGRFGKLVDAKTTTQVRQIVQSEIASRSGSEEYRAFLVGYLHKFDVLSKVVADNALQLAQVKARLMGTQTELAELKKKDAGYAHQIGTLQNQLTQAQKSLEAEKERTACIPAIINSRKILENDLVQLQSEVDIAVTAKTMAESSFQEMVAQMANMKKELAKVNEERVRFVSIVEGMRRHRQVG